MSATFFNRRKLMTSLAAVMSAVGAGTFSEALRIGAEVYRGRWENVGTPEQLAALNATP